MAGNKYQSKYTGEQIDAILDYANNSKEELKNMSDKLKEDIETAIDNIEVPEINEGNLVNTTDNQEINGKKTFNDGIIAYSVDGGDMGLEFKTSSGVDFRSETYFNIDAGGADIDIKTKNKVYINNKEVAVKDDIKAAIDEIELSEIDESNLVHKTGDEEISGSKTFSDEIVVTRISNGNQGLEIEGYDSQIVLKTQSGIILQGGSEINFDCSTVTKRGKSIATIDDITIAIQEAVLDSWAEVVEP